MINAKMGWDEDKADVMQAYIGSSVVLGMTIGAVGGGALMKIGRRKAILITCVVGLAGNLVTMNLSYWNLIIGRVLFGFSVGLFSSICPRFNEETIPAHLFDTLGPTFSFSQTTGTLFAYFFGALIPANDDIPALIAD